MLIITHFSLCFIMASLERWPLAHVPQLTVLSPVLQKPQNFNRPFLVPLQTPNPAVLCTTGHVPFYVTAWTTPFISGDGGEGKELGDSHSLMGRNQPFGKRAGAFSCPGGGRQPSPTSNPTCSELGVLPPRCSSCLGQLSPVAAHRCVPALTRYRAWWKSAAAQRDLQRTTGMAEQQLRLFQRGTTYGESENVFVAWSGEGTIERRPDHGLWGLIYSREGRSTLLVQSRWEKK